MGKVDVVTIKATVVVKEIDPQGKKYHNVSRLCLQCKEKSVAIIVDTHKELLSPAIGDEHEMMIVGNLADKTVDNDAYFEEYLSGVVKDYDYVMYGRLYRIDHVNRHDSAAPKNTVGDATIRHEVLIYVSFGGLLMRIQGCKEDKLEKFKPDIDTVFMLKIESKKNEE